MKTFTKAASAAMVLLSLNAPAQAAITSLDECYDAVLAWCNENYPDMDCSNSSGLDQCDEEFGNAAHSGNPDRLVAVPPRRVMDRIITLIDFQEQQRENADDDRGGDDDDRGSSGGRVD